ncbi:MAG TPA: hypothetical protein PKH02_00625 [Bacteroidales bacterium]|nr:hypothetical protein [Bacteroidales bacterium]HPT11980.1 hypothetical protein [Bacteroidales bacterium]
MNRSSFRGKTRILAVILAITAGCLQLTTALCNGQVPELRNYIADHIPVNNQNWRIFQSPVNGYVYFANSLGLVEYNGISSRLYNMPYRQGIRSVYVDREGTIFTGSFEDFGYWEKDNETGLKYHSLTNSLTIPKNDEIWNIYEMKGVIYFQSFTTIYKYDYKTIKTVSGPTNMLFMFRVGDRFIVQGIGQGLYWFDGNVFEFIPGSEQFGPLKVHAVIERGFDEYWICTSNNGIFIFNGKTFSPQKSEVSEFLKDQTCNGGIAVNDSLIVFGTILDGIVISDERGVIQKEYNYSNGLNNNTVLSLFSDRTGNLWVGLDEGANYINVTSPVTLFANTTGNLGTIYTVLRDNDLLYLGTNHGLFVTDITQKRGDLSFDNLKIIPNTQGQVWELGRFDDQILCGHNDGTYLVGSNGARKISDITGGWSIRKYGDILLEGTYTGIISLTKDNAGRWSYRSRVRDYSEPTRFLEVDYLGYVWAIHQHKGIYRLELNESADSVISKLYFSSISEKPGKLTMAKINNQIVFMTSDYIYTFDYENKKFVPLKSLEHGLGEYIKTTEIIPYRKNSYWFVLGNRIALFNISRDLEAEKVMEFFHQYADLPWREQQITDLGDNRLMVPTREAFSIINLSHLNEKRKSAPVRISRMVFSGRSRSSVVRYDMKARIAVPDRDNNLTVFLSDPDNFDQADKQFMYRIAELGDEWHSTVLDNFTFLNLKFGHYHLQVRPVRDNVVTEVVFYIKRPLLLSTVAFIIYLIIAAGLVWLGMWIFRNEIEKQRKLIEYEVGKNRLESELDYKSYELMLTMRFLIRKTDVLRELHEKLDAMKAYSSKFPVKYIRDMEAIIDHGLDTQNEEWQNVMKNLKLSQEGFFRKLKEKYPQLTVNDLRLCSYLRMNFTTKEIANLSNISSRAVEIGRYRLRQKMNLDHDVNLTEFLIRMGEEL